MASVPFPILYEDNHVLAVVKPPMLPTMGVSADKKSLLDVAKTYIKQKYEKPGNVYLGIVSRLDAPVTGIVLLARTSKAAARLTEQFKNREVEKTYWAITESAMEPSAGRCVDYLYKDERHRRVHVGKPDRDGVQEARLAYRTLANLPRGSLLEIELETGRKHQIRVQLATRDCPIVGDRKYGGHMAYPVGIGLLARKLTFIHPTRRETITLTAPVPKHWGKFGVTDRMIQQLTTTDPAD